MSTHTSPLVAIGDDRWFTKKQAAVLADVDDKTIQRALPTEEDARYGPVRLPNARRDGDGPNAPWLIPGSDLIAAGFCTAEELAGDGGDTPTQALGRQREDRELTNCARIAHSRRSAPGTSLTA